MRLKVSSISKFLKRISFNNTDECWNWNHSKDRDGYGSICVDRRQWKANRFAWLVFNGEDPGDLCVLHKCDNKLCVNPGHLFLGTDKDNNADRKAKGGYNHMLGDNNPRRNRSAKK